ncbi:hypothetical protein BC941DRAFT_510425 [Chlamydoabsidia padenii]|nr:hypothetical protein BC941DRAFT_510425 [Chlamydoabsidia padenii]
MAETLSLSQHSQHNHGPAPLQLDSAPLQSCEVCGRWERQFALQASELANLQKQLDDRDQHLSRLGQDMQQLNSKYVSAIDRVADIQHEKDLVEHDLEELSCKLFEEANEMVAFEKREKWLLETELQTVKQQLMDEQAQLAELRRRLLEWDNDEQQKRRQQQQNKKSYKRSLSQRQHSLITTTLKEEDEEEQCDQYNHGNKENPVGTNEDDYDDYDENDNYDNEDDNDDDDQDEIGNSDDDETWQDSLEDHTNMDDPHQRAQHDLALLHGVQQRTQHTMPDHIPHFSGQKKKKQQPRSVSMPPPPSATIRHTVSPTIDQVQLEAFQQFVHAASTVPLKKLYQFAYMKYCQLEDVEPCLRFGPHSRLSVKKMMDYLLQQPCFIQQMSLEKSTNNSNQHHQQQPMTTVIPSSVAQRSLLWERWHSTKSTDNTLTTTANTSNKKVHSTVTAIGCAACGRSRQKNEDGMDLTTYYQFKMDEKDDWLPMDQYCRDRLVAVCEFFVFIRNIHLRLYAHREIGDLYSENIRLRLQMFYSRMGALPVILGGIGLNADAIGKACPPLDQDYISDGSISSHYLPTTPK